MGVRLGENMKRNNRERFCTAQKIRQSIHVNPNPQKRFCLSHKQMLTIMFVLFLPAYLCMCITHIKAHIIAPLTNYPEKAEGPSMTHLKLQTACLQALDNFRIHTG